MRKSWGTYTIKKMFQIKERYIFWMVLFFIAFIYFMYFPVSYDFDGTVFSHFLRYAVAENDLKTVIQPHHLLYFPLNFAIYKTLNQLTGYQVLEYFHLQLFSLLFGILTLMVCYKIFKKIMPDGFSPLMALLLIAVSYGFWNYSVEAEVHMAGLFFSVSGIYVLFFREFGFKNLILSALLFSLASGFHLTHVLIAISVILFFIYEKRSLASVSLFFVSYAVFFVLPYLVYYFITRIQLFKHFQVTLFGDNPFSGYRINRWESLSWDTFLSSMKAIGNSILYPENAFSVLIFALLLLLFLVFVFSKRQKVINKSIFLKFVFWMIPYFVFFSFWESHNLEFKLSLLIPFWAMFVFSVSCLENSKLGKPFLVFLVVVLFSLNFFGSLKPRNDIHTNTNYRLSRAIQENTPASSTIFIAGKGKNAYNHGKIYIPYFAQRNVNILDWKLGKGTTLSQLEQEIKSRLDKGERVFFLSEILLWADPLKDILMKHKLSQTMYFDFVKKIRFSKEIRLGKGLYLREVEEIVLQD